MKKLLILPLLLMCCLTFTGCPKASSTQDVVKVSSQVMEQFSSVLLQAQNITIKLHTSGLMDDATYADAQKQFASIATAGISVDSLLRAGDKTNAKVALNSMSAQLQLLILQGKAGIKDTASQNEYVLAIGAIQSIIQSVEATL